MRAKEALEISRKVAEEVRKEVKKLAGKSDADLFIEIGKNGTPTKKIDKVAESKAIEILREYDVTILSEEAGIIGDSEIIVALDPVDGTFNAVRGIPIYSISMNFSKGNKILNSFFGYVMNLATGDEYYADRRAYKNEERIEVGNREDIECNAIVYYPWKKLPFRRIRIFGSASLEICFVAEGTMDCFIDVREKNGKGFLRCFDVSASIYIAKNAGAVITDPEGRGIENKKISMEERFRLVIANEKLHKKIIKAL